MSLSFSRIFNEARKEWSILSFDLGEDWHACPCGQSIKEQCHIVNRITGHRTYVGNVCICRFMGYRVNALTDGLKRLMYNITANANEAVINLARVQGVVEQAQADFLMDTRNKRVLTANQLSYKVSLNKKILAKLVVKRGPIAKPQPAPLVEPVAVSSAPRHATCVGGQMDPDAPAPGCQA